MANLEQKQQLILSGESHVCNNIPGIAVLRYGSSIIDELASAKSEFHAKADIMEYYLQMVELSDCMSKSDHAQHLEQKTCQ